MMSPLRRKLFCTDFYKTNLIVVIVLCTLCTAQAQIDKSAGGGFKIPAKVDTTEAKLPNNEINAPLNLPKTANESVPELRNPLAEAERFNMLKDPMEGFVDPTEKYTKMMNDRLYEQIKERVEIPGTGSKQDKNYGTFVTNSSAIRVLCRDFGRVDGDFVSISLNGSIQMPRLGLGFQFSNVPIQLVQGLNEIAITALTQGTVSPNTAEFIVIDAQGKEIFRDQWNLANGYSAKFSFIKE